MRQLTYALSLCSLTLAGCGTSGDAYLVTTEANSVRQSASARDALEASIAHHASAHNIPESLVRAVVRRESNFNPAARNGPYWGLMQIRYDTARGLGYKGSPAGLLDADTNLTYGVAYLANAYTVARGDASRAQHFYKSGYYYEAKRRGLLDRLQTADASQ
jgi:soluble lytic murein transglycosylase-like protein